GTRTYWADWAVNVAEIAQKHITRINGILAHTDSEAYRAFQAFLHELQKNINASVTAEEVVEMLAQHMITQPVFEALFADYDFNANNPVSQAIQKVLDVLNKHHIDSEAEKLQGFYASVKARVAGIDNDRGKQKIIVELYDKFFRSAFPRLTDRLGIVYTPVECVDFIIHSVNDVLQQEFGQTLADEHTHIIDPFAGTGTFITRIIQSGLIDKARLAHKYQHELHANEIVLLAYYLASINIESAYHAAMLPAHDAATGPDQHAYLQAADASGVYQQAYQPFEGICLTDTFQLYEQDEHLLTPQLPVNSKRLNRQKKLDIKVILGNPPYSAGQKSGNDNNQNLSYPNLDTSIEDSYAKHSQSANQISLYDSYIRAMRWASDRIGDTGVIGFITNAGWLESNTADGMRKALQEEFSSIYIFHLRGNQRTSGELSRKEGGKIFGGGSRTPIAITILVKNPQASSQGAIYFCDIGDYLSREDKLKIIRQYQSIQGISQQHGWQRLEPDKYHDWLNQRDDSFYEHIPIGAKKSAQTAIFDNYSLGLATGRDAWVYNASQSALEGNIKGTIAFYNQELQRYQRLDKTMPVKDFINYDSTQIAWSEDDRDALRRHLPKSFHHKHNSTALYRPFTQMHCYYSKEMIQRTYQMPQIFPEASLDNLVIGVSGKRSSGIPFSCLISNTVPDLEFISKSQCFPLKLYERVEPSKQKPATLTGYSDSTAQKQEVAAASGERYWLRDGITDAGLKHFADYYPQQQISKEDLFYYIYGLLHSEDYRSRFAANLTKALPHVPRVKSYAHFAAFAQAGRQLADLHLNYEHKQPYPVDFECGKATLDSMSADAFTVQKMRFKTQKDKSADKSTIVYNDNITITGIPLQAYDYLVNSRSAIEWVMERQRISTHKDSGIVNNPNDWAVETMGNPRYPLDLLLKVIGISVESVRIIKALPALKL
ncbi:MAG: type ISP restriction/modification enzyme, partial [Gammaproteobacteria bacterium]